MANNTFTSEQLYKQHCILTEYVSPHLEEEVHRTVFYKSSVPWDKIGGYEFVSGEEEDNVILYQILRYLPTISDEGLDAYMEMTAPQCPDSLLVNNAIEIDSNLAHHCTNLDDCCATVYLTENQLNTFREKMTLKYDEYLKDTYKQSLTDVVGLHKNREVVELLKDWGCPTDKLSSLTPLVGYRCNDVEKIDSSLVLHNEINVVNKEGVGYKTYKWDLYVNPYSGEVDAEKSFDLDKIVQIPNEYDKINELTDSLKVCSKPVLVVAEKAFATSRSSYEAKLKEANNIRHSDLSGTIEALNAFIQVHKEALAWMTKSAELMAKNAELYDRIKIYPDIEASYINVLAAIDCSWNTSNDYSALNQIESLQNKTEEFVNLRDKIAENEEAIQKSGAAAPLILAPYAEFAAQVDLSWTPYVDLVKLQKHIQMQQQTQKLIDNNAKIVENSAKIREEGAAHVDLITAYNTYIGSDIVWTPEVDVVSTEKILDVQQKTLTFVQLRNMVVENDVYLKEHSSAGKGLYKLYTVYRDPVNLSWTPDVDMTVIETLIGIQEDTKTMLAYDDISEVCKSIKKAKIKDIVTAIQNYKK